MIKINELRNGNLLEANIKYAFDGGLNWKTIEVIGLEDNSIFRPEEPNKVFFFEPDIATFNLYRKFTKLDDEFLRPIPLTEEWLLKFGFVEKNIPNNYIKELIVDNFLYIIIREDNTVICTSEPNSVISMMQIGKTKFVHQLQNLYFALTGEELVVSDAVS